MHEPKEPEPEPCAACGGWGREPLEERYVTRDMDQARLKAAFPEVFAHYRELALLKHAQTPPTEHAHKVFAYDEAVKCFTCNVVKHGAEAVALWRSTPEALRAVLDGPEPGAAELKREQVS